MSDRADTPDGGEPGGERRGSGRRRQAMLLSSLGPVLDLSLGGARIASRKPRSGDCRLILITEDGPVAVDAQAVWSKRTGFWRYEVGLQFVNVSAETQQQLTLISSGYQYLHGHAA